MIAKAMNHLMSSILTRSGTIYQLQVGFLQGEKVGNLIMKKPSEESFYILKKIRFINKRLRAEYVKIANATLKMNGTCQIIVSDPATTETGLVTTDEIVEIRDAYLIRNLIEKYNDIKIYNMEWWTSVYNKKSQR